MLIYQGKKSGATHCSSATCASSCRSEFESGGEFYVRTDQLFIIAAGPFYSRVRWDFVNKRHRFHACLSATASEFTSGWRTADASETIATWIAVVASSLRTIRRVRFVLAFVDANDATPRLKSNPLISSWRSPVRSNNFLRRNFITNY